MAGGFLKGKLCEIIFIAFIDRILLIFTYVDQKVMGR